MPADIGQAHNQIARAQAEYGAHGYVIRGAVVTHLDALDPAAEASAGAIRIILRNSVIELWNRVRLLLSLYRDHWSLDDMHARAAGVTRIQAQIPHTGWLPRAFENPQRFVSVDQLLAEWRSRGEDRKIARQITGTFSRCSIAKIAGWPDATHHLCVAPTLVAQRQRQGILRRRRTCTHEWPASAGPSCCRLISETRPSGASSA